MAGDPSRKVFFTAIGIDSIDAESAQSQSAQLQVGEYFVQERLLTMQRTPASAIAAVCGQLLRNHYYRCTPDGAQLAESFDQLLFFIATGEVAAHDGGGFFPALRLGCDDSNAWVDTDR